MSRKMLSIPVFVLLALLVAGSVEARPLADLPGSFASIQELWVRASSSLATIFQKEGSAGDPNGLKRQGVRRAPAPKPGTTLPKLGV